MSNDHSPAGETIGAEHLPFNDLAPAARAAFDVQDGIVLLRGSRSRSSGSLAFPARQVCMETGARDMEDMLFGPEGTLYSYSTIHLSATRPVPYTLGYVDFPNGVRVLAHVRTDDLAALACDTPVVTATDGTDWFVVPVR